LSRKSSVYARLSRSSRRLAVRPRCACTLAYRTVPLRAPGRLRGRWAKRSGYSVKARARRPRRPSSPDRCAGWRRSPGARDGQVQAGNESGHGQWVTTGGDTHQEAPSRWSTVKVKPGRYGVPGAARTGRRPAAGHTPRACRRQSRATASLRARHAPQSQSHITDHMVD